MNTNCNNDDDDILSTIVQTEKLVPFLQQKNVIRANPPMCTKCNMRKEEPGTRLLLFLNN